ncbi:MAG: hypothetical protein ACO1OK_00285 [Devosia sp.]
MLRVLIAAALTLVASPAMADPVSIGAAIAGVASWWASIGVVGQALVQIGIGLVFAGASYLISGAGRRAENAGATNLATVNVPQRDGLLERVRLYGTDTTPGGVFFQKTASNGVTSNLSVYVYGVAISEGVCEALEAVIINGVECRVDSSGVPLDAPWNDGNLTYFKVSFRAGTEDQAIDPIIAARFPGESVEFRQRGVCTVVIEMEFGTSAEHHATLWGAAGVPQLLFRVKGLRVFDPRVATQLPDDSTTWAWSDNAALVQADWLTCAMGFSIAPEKMDWASFRTAADVDDRNEPTLAGSERRGRINGRVYSSETNASVIEAMLQQNRGMCWRSEGLVHLRSDEAAEPVATLHQDLLVGDIAYQSEPDMRAALNTVRVEFRPASRFNQSAELTVSVPTDDDQEYEQAISLPYCDSPAAAQWLAYALIKENRAGRSLSMLLDIACLFAAGKPNKTLEVGDVVLVDMRNYATIGGLYRVADLEISSEFTVSIKLNGYDPATISGWSVDLEQPFTEEE